MDALQATSQGLATEQGPRSLFAELRGLALQGSGCRGGSRDYGVQELWVLFFVWGVPVLRSLSAQLPRAKGLEG